MIFLLKYKNHFVVCAIGRKDLSLIARHFLNSCSDESCSEVKGRYFVLSILGLWGIF